MERDIHTVHATAYVFLQGFADALSFHRILGLLVHETSILNTLFIVRLHPCACT
jgi:hypothetical protein